MPSAFQPAFQSPMKVHVVHGEVVILGPDAISVSMTPDAAEESALRLLEAARKARVLPIEAQED
jgi:hypothetical protein